MTIAAGFRCRDGIVLCTDSQITVQSLSKYPGEKIIGFPKLKSRPIFAFAGHVNFSKMCIYQIVKEIERTQTDSTLDLYGLLKSECKKLWEEYANFDSLFLIVTAQEGGRLGNRSEISTFPQPLLLAHLATSLPGKPAVDTGE